MIIVIENTHKWSSRGSNPDHDVKLNNSNIFVSLVGAYAHLFTILIFQP